MSTNIVPLSPEEYKYIIVGVFGFTIFAIKLIQYFIEEKRKEEIANYCQKNKIDYSLLMEESEISKSDSDLFKSYSKAIAVMSGNIEDYKYYIFDFVNTVITHNTKSSNNYPTVGKTACIIYKDNITFPHFFIRGESILFDHILDYNEEDINFTEDPVFSKNFILVGAPEQDVRDFFDRKRRDSFVRKHIRGYIYEGYKNSLIISVNKVLGIKERLSLLNNSINIFKDIVPESQNDK